MVSPAEQKYAQLEKRGIGYCAWGERSFTNTYWGVSSPLCLTINRYAIFSVSSDQYHPCLPALSSDNECLWLAIEFWLGETVLLMELLQSSSVNVNQIKIMIPSFQKWVISHCTENPLLSAVLEWWKNSIRDIQESRAWSHLFAALCVVRNGLWPGSESEKLSAVSNYKAFSPPPAPLHPWEWPQRGQSPCGLYRPISWKDVPCCPWFSKWKEVKVVSAATSAITTEKLRVMFAIHGLLEMLVSDNGSCFTGVELQ